MGLFAWRPPFPEALRREAAVKRYWEIIADNLSKAGWSWSRVSAVAFLRANIKLDPLPR